MSENPGKPLDLEDYKAVHKATRDIIGNVSLEEEKICWHGDVGAQILEYEPEALSFTLEKIPELVYLPDQQSFLPLWNEFLKGNRIDHACRFVTPKDKPIWCHLIGFPHREGHMLIFRGIDRIHVLSDDVAESKRLQTIETMAAGVAHEFNNHLTPIRGFIELSLNDLSADHPVTSGLEIALERTLHAAELVEAIQSYGKKSLLSPRLLDIHPLISSVFTLKLASQREKGRNIKLIQRFDTSPIIVEIDQDRFRTALLQIIDNSVIAMPNGGEITVKTSYVEKKELAARYFTCIRIKDTGIGIDKKNLEHIFDPFFTTRNRALAKGMGLSMVQGIVLQHGGWIDILSEKGKGTEVIIYLPVTEDRLEIQKRLPKPDPEKDGKKSRDNHKGHILVADDEENIRQLLIKLLTPRGWKIDEVLNNNEVLQKLESDPMKYTLLMLDLTMPGPSAENILSEIRKMGSTTQVIIVSGAARDDRVEDLLKDQKVEFINKPFSPQVLLDHVEKILTEK